jgi:hypothetical protein
MNDGAAPVARSTVALGWALFGLSLAVFGLTFAAAFAYLALD